MYKLYVFTALWYKMNVCMKQNNISVSSALQYILFIQMYNIYIF